MMSIIDKGTDKDGNHKFEVRVSCGYRNGKQIRIIKVFHCKTKRAAQKKMEKFLLENQLDFPDSKSMPITFGDFVATIWFNQHERYLAKSTQIKNQGLLDDQILDFFGDRGLDTINVDDIRSFLSHLRCKKAIKGGKETEHFISKTMVYNHYRLLHSILAKAESWKFIPQNPCDLLEPFEKPHPQYHPAPIWQEADLKRFIDFLEGLPETRDNLQKKLIFYLFLETGMRRGELSALTFDCIDTNEKSIFINKAVKVYDGKTLVLSDPKTESSLRKVFIDDFLLGLLKKHRLMQEEFLKSKGLANPMGFVFITQRLSGELIPITPTYFYGWLRKAAKLLSLPLIDVHSLRHMSASYALAKGAPLTSVATQLGHSSIRTTQIYLHELDSQKKESSRIISDEIAKLRGC